MIEVAEAERFLTALAVDRVAGRLDALVEHFHADAVFRVVGVSEPVTGKDAIRSALQVLIDTYEFLEWSPIKTFVHDDDIAVRQRLKVRHRGTGNVAETETCEFLTVKEGKCTSFVQFADTAMVHALARD